MKKIAFFNSIAEAGLAKNVLKEHNIESLVQRRGLEFPGDLGDSFGADLLVGEQNAKKAKQILELSENEQ